MSKLQVATLVGWLRANALRVLMAANLRVGFGDERKSWRTAIERVNWLAVTFFISQIARAAS